MHLKLKNELKYSLNLAPLSEIVSGKTSISHIQEIGLQYGNQKVAPHQLFEVVDSHKPDNLLLEGNLSKADFLGERLSDGKIHVLGNIGNHLGQSMQGGVIEVEGNANNQCGCDLQGGTIDISGNVGDFAGCPLPGNRRGMQGGTMLIRGSAGKQLGYRQRRGTIVVCGDTAELTAYEMLAGTIVIGGRLGKLPGLRMKRGTLIALQQTSNEVPASFIYDCEYSPAVIALIKQSMMKYNLALSLSEHEVFQLYSGDTSEMSRGEILIPA